MVHKFPDFILNRPDFQYIFPCVPISEGCQTVYYLIPFYQGPTCYSPCLIFYYFYVVPSRPQYPSHTFSQVIFGTSQYQGKGYSRIIMSIYLFSDTIQAWKQHQNISGLVLTRYQLEVMLFLLLKPIYRLVYVSCFPCDVQLISHGIIFPVYQVKTGKSSLEQISRVYGNQVYFLFIFTTRFCVSSSLLPTII